MATAQRTCFGLLGVGLAAVLPIALRGFTVDDALISTRYAMNVARGSGHRFNPAGPVTDGVTPLPWPYLLAPFAADGPLPALHAAKWIGTAAWMVAAFFLAIHIGRIAGEARWKSLPALTIAFATPAVGAWVVSGMETGIALSLTTMAAIAGATPRWRPAVPACVGLATTFRPELMPLALTLAVGCAFTNTTETLQRARSTVGFVALALVPFALIGLARTFLFDGVAPLALRAKPSDLEHGLVYVVASCLIMGPPVAVLAPLAWQRLTSWPMWLLGGFAVHALTCLLVGGDWMPMSRLFVPAAPMLAIVFAHLTLEAATWSTALRFLLCAAGQVFVLTTVGPAASRVHQDRRVLIDHLRPLLEKRHVIASVDIGWVGAAHDGTVTDLAGVTDPEVAGLRGGHTSKRVPESLFDTRRVTHIVLLLPQSSEIDAGLAWRQCRFARSVESRICRMPSVRKQFVIIDEIRATARLRYLLLGRVSAR